MRPIDLEVFIEAIKDRQTIWNTTSDEYFNRDIRLESWKEVAEIVIDEWPTLDEGSQLKRVQELQKKWKGLRDYFAREHRKIFSAKQSGQPILKRRKSPTLDLLQFLHVLYDKGYYTQTDVPYQGAKAGADEEDSFILPPGGFDSDSQSSSSSYTSPNTPKKKFRAQEKPKLKQKKTEEDPDMCFLLSILPDMKSMTADQNFDFRYEMMKIIKKIKSNIDDSNPLS